jgi:hypothetical protein
VRDRWSAIDKETNVTDFATLIEIVAYTALVVAPAAVLGRLLAGGDGPTLPDVLRAPLDPPWPRGVQEEEPLPWQLDRLPVRPTVANPRSKDCAPVGLAYPGAVH